MIDDIKDYMIQKAKEDKYHPNTIKFFQEHDELYQTLTPGQEGFIDGFLTALDKMLSVMIENKTNISDLRNELK